MMIVKSVLLLGLFTAAAYGQDPFLQPPAPAPPKADYLNGEAWKHAFQGLFGKSNQRLGNPPNIVFKPPSGRVFHVIEGSRPDVCAVRLLEVPLPRNVEAWTPQVVPPADGYSTVEAQVPAPACPKG
jgi:hypothetical protein